MLEHPGIELQVLIKEKGLTQKAFSSILGKKVSEVNELLKGKRNITIQRDYLLHQTLGTPIKYWILKQIDYDYSLLDIEETPSSPLRDGKSHKSSLLGEDLDGAVEGLGEIGNHSEYSEESIGANMSFGTEGRILGDNEQSIQDSLSQTPQNDNITQTSHSEHSEESIGANMSSGATAKDLKGEMNKSNTQNSPSQTLQNDNITQTHHSESEGHENLENSPLDKGDTAKPRGFEQPQESPIKEPNSKDDEDLKNRAKIFKTF